RLAERLEDVPPELRELVHEEDAAVRERYLAGADRAAPAEERGVGDRAVRCAHGPCRDERPPIEKPRDAVDRRHLDRLLQRERRQDGRQAAREHRLAGAWRADEQQTRAGSLLVGTTGGSC